MQPLTSSSGVNSPISGGELNLPLSAPLAGFGFEALQQRGTLRVVDETVAEALAGDAYKR
jgi:hypothetical protein